MAKIQTVENILEWARKVVEANGDRFTPLTKGEQYLIAKYILETVNGMGERQTTKDSADGNPHDPVSVETGLPAEPLKRKIEEPVQDKSDNEDEKKPTTEQPQKNIRMSRGAAFHLIGLSPQKTYDEYLKWADENHKEKSVMDFSTGCKNESAAFAYYLCELVNVKFKGDQSGL